MDVPPGTSALRPRRPDAAALAQLLESADVRVVLGAEVGAVRVSGVTADSRLVQSGDLYLALGGGRTHGARFLPAAITAGAVAVLTDPAGRELIESTGEAALPVVVLDDPRSIMAGLAAQIYRYPAAAMTMFGVTGTTGKTTTSYLVQAGLRSAGRRAGLIGTLGYRIDDETLPGTRTTVTTPESPEVQGLLAAMRERGAEAVAMEVSSHALALGRADAIVFDSVGFTNFGRDHLDFHGSEQAYFEAKAALFTAERARHAVINTDDPRGGELVARARAEGLPVSTTSLGGSLGGHVDTADYLVERTEAAAGLTRVRLRAPGGTLDFDLGLPGSYNVHNAVTALAMLAAAGIDPAAAAQGFGALSVPGRMQPVDLGAHAPAVYVDFAHTPEAITSALTALASRAGDGRLICVVGCGGDRDPDKRRPMGAAAARGADVVIITDDNPRSEDPAAIRAEALAGAEQAIRTEGLSSRLVDGGDRRSALAAALELARGDDVLAVLGKGHEVGQEIAGHIWPFDDAAVITELWQDGRP